MRRILVTVAAALAGACSSGVAATGPTAAGPEPAEPRPGPVAAPAPEPPAGPAPGRPLDAQGLEALAACWFEDPYEYMFSGGQGVTVGGRDFGTFMAGVSGILHYGDLNGCAGRLSGSPPRSYSDDAPFAALSGLALHSERMSEGQPFGFYHPEIVRWGARYLLPAADATVAGVPVRTIYSQVFSRFFRMMTEAYLHLAASGAYSREMDAYWQMAQSPDADGIDWLQARYASALPAYGAGADGTTMTPQMAIGFWLRRGIDGTAGELWTGLRTAMRRFDGAWYGELPQRYPSPAIEW